MFEARPGWSRSTHRARLRMTKARARARVVSVRDLRTRNRARALAAVYHNGPMTRQEIGEASGVSPATVSNLVGDLLTHGVIVEAAAEDSNGGRPRTLLRVKPEHRFPARVDVR